ncbi:TPA: hypothetical protein ACF37V_004684 [Vibrio parahaemolyticus]|nr:hypothetical protein [Vibrio parahaemolyticus]
MNTEIFENYDDFKQRLNKNINGVSKKFSEKHPNYQQMNLTNTGCWECVNSKDCLACIRCYDCANCNGCFDCARCIFCSDSIYCIACNECDGCIYCTACRQCKFCDNCVWDATIEFKGKMMAALL